MANLSFSIASVAFADVAKKTNPMWLNCFKTLASFVAVTITVCIYIFFEPFPFDIRILITLISSGLVGLCVGDFLMLSAMKEIGGSRMVMLFGLTPFLTGLGSSIFFNSNLKIQSWIGVLFMVLCLIFLSLEQYKKSGNWQLKGILYGIAAVFLDSVGLILTKSIYLSYPDINTIYINFYRLIGALIGFLIIQNFIKPIKIKETFQGLSFELKRKAVISSLLGTYVSLLLFLKAVSLGHLSVVSSVAGTGPLFAKVFECIEEKRLPHLYWFISFLFMIVGFYFFASAG